MHALMHGHTAAACAADQNFSSSMKQVFTLDMCYHRTNASIPQRWTRLCML